MAFVTTPCSTLREAPLPFSSTGLRYPAPPAGFLAGLDGFGYDGFCSIDLFNDDLWATPVEEASRLLYDSLLPYRGQPHKENGPDACRPARPNRWL